MLPKKLPLPAAELKQVLLVAGSCEAKSFLLINSADLRAATTLVTALAAP